MNPVSTAWCSPPSSTSTVLTCPPMRASASKTVRSWSRCSRWAATSPDTPVPTIAIFMPTPRRRRPGRRTSRRARRRRTRACGSPAGGSVGRRRRSCQKSPLDVSAAGEEASHTAVSAPCAGVRRSGRSSDRKRGNDPCRPGVSAQPGCRAWNAMSAVPGRSGQRAFSTTWARLALAYARVPWNGAGGALSAATSRRCGYIPPDDTVRTRAPFVDRRRGRSRFVSRNGATTCTWAVSSIPSTVRSRSWTSAPALWTTTSSRSVCVVSSSARVRTSSSTVKSLVWVTTDAPGTSSRSFSIARVSLTSSRPTRRTSAPRRANPLAVASPRPPVAPVTTATRPRRSGAGSSSQSNRARRAAYPTRVKLPTTVASRATSAATRATSATVIGRGPRRASGGGRRRRGRRSDGSRVRARGRTAGRRP